MDKVEFYKDSSAEWRWRYINSDNGKIMADSGEGYANLSDAEAGAGRLFDRTKVNLTLSLET